MDGIEVVFRVALAILSMAKHELLSLDMEGMLKVFIYIMFIYSFAAAQNDSLFLQQCCLLLTGDGPKVWASFFMTFSSMPFQYKFTNRQSHYCIIKKLFTTVSPT